MPYKKIINSTVPNVYTKHYWQTEDVRGIATTVTELSRQAFANGKILSVTKYKDVLHSRTEVTWVSQEEMEAVDSLLYSLHPEFQAARDAYNQANGIEYSITHETV